jgi:hypothetical protein
MMAMVFGYVKNDFHQANSSGGHEQQKKPLPFALLSY